LVKKLVLTAVALLAISTGALAVSVGELVKNCGDDSKAHCEGVGYGDAMTECLAQHSAELQPQCKIIVDRVKGGEKVSLF